MAALDDVGLFDDDLFLYFEDTDLSWRLRAHGWEVWYEPAAVVRHVYAASSGTASDLFVYQQARNMLIVFTRHAPLGTAVWVVVRFLLALPWRAIRELPRLSPTWARLARPGRLCPPATPSVLGAPQDVGRGRRRSSRGGPLAGSERERGRRTGGSAAPSRGDASTR